MALRRLLAGVAQGALRAAQQQLHAPPCTLAAAGSFTAPRPPAAAAAARLFGSSSLSSSSSSSSSSLGLASLQQLAQRGSGVAAAAGGRIACSGSVVAAAGAGRAAGAAGWLRQQLRWRNDSSHLVPKFKGGKMKSYSSYKSRFKVTGSGQVVYKRAGYVHKRFNKSKSALGRLGGPLAVMKPKYAKTVRKLGFKTRRLS